MRLGAVIIAFTACTGVEANLERYRFVCADDSGCPSGHSCQNEMCAPLADELDGEGEGGEGEGAQGGEAGEGEGEAGESEGEAGEGEGEAGEGEGEAGGGEGAAAEGEGEGEAPRPCLDTDQDQYDDCAVGVVGGDARPTDCHDGTPVIHPGADEIVCNGIDENCNGDRDDHPDADGDGHDACEMGVPGADDEPADCDDDAPDVNMSKAERPCNGVDENCSGQDDDNPDGDADGFDSCGPDAPDDDGQPADCQDGIGDINPGVGEVCDGVDNNCDAVVDVDSRDCGVNPCVGGVCAPVGQLVADDWEDNDSLSEAAPTPPGTHQPLSIVGEDVDWFRISACAGGIIEIEVAFNSGVGDIDVELHDHQGLPLDSSKGAITHLESILWGVQASGWYYGRVFGYEGAQNVYALTVRTPDCGCVHECPADGAQRCEEQAGFRCEVNAIDGCLAWRPDEEACAG